MLERLAGFADFFEGQREIVVSVGIGGSELQGRLVGLNRFLHAPGLIEHIAEVEIRKGVARIGFNRLAVMLFREREILTVVIERAQIDVRRRMRWLKLEHLMIGGNRFGLRVGIFFQRDAARKPDATSCSRGLGSDFGTGVLVTTFSRSEKSMRNCPAIGSSRLPSCRNATRCFAVDRALASSSGFSTPEACLRMASSDWRMTAGRTLMAHKSRTFLISRRSEKE